MVEILGISLSGTEPGLRKLLSSVLARYLIRNTTSRSHPSHPSAVRFLARRSSRPSIDLLPPLTLFSAMEPLRRLEEVPTRLQSMLRGRMTADISMWVAPRPSKCACSLTSLRS